MERGGGGKNPNPKQMASIGARNTENHRKRAALLSLIHTFQSLRGAGTVNYRSLVILWGKLRHAHYYTRTNELMIMFQPSEVLNDNIIYEKGVYNVSGPIRGSHICADPTFQTKKKENDQKTDTRCTFSDADPESMNS